MEIQHHLAVHWPTDLGHVIDPCHVTQPAGALGECDPHKWHLFLINGRYQDLIGDQITPINKQFLFKFNS